MSNGTDAGAPQAERRLGLIERLPVRRIVLVALSTGVGLAVVYGAYKTLTLPEGERYTAASWRDFIVLGIAQGAVYALIASWLGMIVYLWVRFLDLFHRGALRLLSQNRIETWLFLLEVALLVVPTALLYQIKVRMSPGALYACAVMVVFGIIANRLNVGITGLEAGSGTQYWRIHCFSCFTGK